MVITLDSRTCLENQAADDPPYVRLLGTSEALQFAGHLLLLSKLVLSAKQKSESTTQATSDLCDSGAPDQCIPCISPKKASQQANIPGICCCGLLQDFTYHGQPFELSAQVRQGRQHPFISWDLLCHCCADLQVTWPEQNICWGYLLAAEQGGASSGLLAGLLLSCRCAETEYLAADVLSGHQDTYSGRWWLPYCQPMNAQVLKIHKGFSVRSVAAASKSHLPVAGIKCII